MATQKRPLMTGVVWSQDARLNVVGGARAGRAGGALYRPTLSRWAALANSAKTRGSARATRMAQYAVSHPWRRWPRRVVACFALVECPFGPAEVAWWWRRGE